MTGPLHLLGLATEYVDIVSPRPPREVLDAVATSVRRRRWWHRLGTWNPVCIRVGADWRVWWPEGRKSGPAVMAYVSAVPHPDGSHVVLEIRPTRVGWLVGIVLDAACVTAAAAGALVRSGESLAVGAIGLVLLVLNIWERRVERTRLRDLLLPLVS